MKHLILIAIFLIIVFSCRKDNPVDPSTTNKCENFDKQIDKDICDFGVLFKDGSPNYEKPCFNPSNADEFVYQHGNAIWRFSISKNQSTLVKDGVRPYTQLDWGKSGWITFTNDDKYIWLLKDTGNELKKLDSLNKGWGGEFNHDGKKIIFGRSLNYSNADLNNNPILREQYKMLVRGLNGNSIDSFCRRDNENLCYIWLLCSWSPDEQQFAVPENGIRIYDTEGNPLSQKLKDHDVIIHYDIEWYPLGNIIFFTDNQGLKMVDISTEQFVTIKESCDSKKYMDISISNDCKTILASREISTYSKCSITSRMELVLMDIDGSNERVVDLE